VTENIHIINMLYRKAARLGSLSCLSQVGEKWDDVKNHKPGIKKNKYNNKLMAPAVI